MQIPFNTTYNPEDSWHPIDACIPDLLQIIQDIQGRDYSFDKEIKEVASISFSLQKDPQEDVVIFNELYAEVQSQLSRISSIVIEMYREKAWWQKQYHIIKRLYRKARTLLLHTRADIKALKNKELQEAAIHEEIREVVDLMGIVENVIEDLELSIDLVTVKREELDKANTNLSRQQKVLDTLVGLGYPVHARREME
jgi:hypothetical protein